MRTRKLFLILTTIALSLVSFSFSPYAKAYGAASLTLTGGSSYQNGQAVAISIIENSGSVTVNAAGTTVIYDTNKLQYQNFVPGSFSCPFVTPSPGSININCATLASSVTGSQALGMVNFIALSGSGNTTITAQDTMIGHPINESSSEDIWNGVSASKIISFTTPAPTNSSPPQSTQKTNTTTSATDNSQTQSSQEQVAVSSSETEAGVGDTKSTSVLSSEDSNEVSDPEINIETNNSAVQTLLLTVGVLGLIYLSRYVNKHKRNIL